ncbi:MAG TPA: hypothetical protein VFC54_13885 [Pseudolabrys sp.]|nr:hypothetical protein [Pseudolabrys sp.]
MSIGPTTNRLLQWVLPVLAIAVALFGVFAILDRMALDERAADRRALAARDAGLTESVLRPGSPLSCLDASAGEAAENACEAAIFASPQSAAAAVTYTGARLTLLADAQRFDPAYAATLAAGRRAIELDRFGIAAHVLAERDGCTANKCAAFAFVTDTGALKGNMKAQAYDQYVSRHADAWNAPATAAVPPAAISQAPSALLPAAKAAAAETKSGELVAHPLSDKYQLPSAASIPAVSIMNKEPPLPQAVAPAAAQPQAQPETAVPVPPKRPQAQSQQAAPPPAR